MIKQVIKIIVYGILFISISCNKKEKTENFEQYSMVIPSNWEKIKLKGIDSNIYLILTDRGDSIFSDFGRYSQKFEETVKVFSKAQIVKYKALGMDTEELYSSANPEIDQSQGTFLREYYYYDTIDGKIAKIKIPKKAPKGQTGINFDSVDSRKNSLTITAEDLSQEEQHLLLKSFTTIRFNSIKK